MLPVPPKNTSAAKCPKCGQQDCLRAVTFEDRDEDGALMLWLGGLWAFLLHRATQDDLLLCEKCSVVFTPKEEDEKEPVKEVSMPAAIVLILGALIIFSYLVWRTAIR